MTNKNTATSTGEFLKRKLLEQTKERFQSIEEMYPTHFYAKATMLDPRFKKAAFTSDFNANKAEEEIQNEIADHLKNNGK